MDIDFKKELNKEQYNVVTSGGGPHLVLAGAGSGKTRALVYRVAWLLSQGVKPQDILLLTFTNKAANEMMERVRGILRFRKDRKLPLWSGTFHSIANRLLHIYGHHIDIPKDFTILDAEDSKSLIKDISKTFLNNLSKNHKPSSGIILETISFSVNSNISIEESLEIKFPEWITHLEIIEKIKAEYIKRKKASKVLDFDDLLVFTKTLTEHPAASQVLSNKWKYILVDEYQDTNIIQAQMIFNLSQKHKNILVVGDDAQSIYSFRAADIRNILDFPKIFNNTKVHKLETNYRSTPEILDLANVVISENYNQFSKNLKAILDSYIKPELVALRTNVEESLFIANRIEGLLADGLEYKDIAVLFRAAHHSQVLEMELNKRNIPYEIRGGLKFFERAHIKDIIAFLRIFLNYKDEVSWRRVLEMYEGIGPVMASKIYKEISSLNSLDDINNLKLKTNDKVSLSWGKVKKIFNILLDNKKEDIGKLISLISESYEEYLVSKYSDYSQRIEDIKQLALFASSYTDLESFLSQVSLQISFTEASEKSSNDNVVILSTVHQAKGLEWPAVFVMNLTNKSFPHPLAVKEEEQEEERRLLYVALTRAMKNLFLTYPLSVFNYDGYQSLQPSDFIININSKLLNYNELASGAGLSSFDDIEYVFDEDSQTKKSKGFLPDVNNW